MAAYFLHLKKLEQYLKRLLKHLIKNIEAEAIETKNNTDDLKKEGEGNIKEKNSTAISKNSSSKSYNGNASKLLENSINAFGEKNELFNPSGSLVTKTTNNVLNFVKMAVEFLKEITFDPN